MLLRYQGLYVRLNDLRQKWDLSLGLLGDGRRRLGRLGISARPTPVGILGGGGEGGVSSHLLHGTAGAV